MVCLRRTISGRRGAWILAIICLAATQPRRVDALLPAPKLWTNGSIPLILSPDFTINFDEDSFTDENPVPRDVRRSLSLSLQRKRAHDEEPLGQPHQLRGNVDLALSYLDKDYFQRLIVGRGETDRSRLSRAGRLRELTLSIPPSHDGTTRVLPVSEEALKRHEDQDEGYEFHIGAGSSLLLANTTLGLVRGLQTFVQLVYSLPPESDPALDRGERTRYILDTPLHIRDAPSFKYRGFSLDTARHFYPVRDIERTIETMSWAKMNVFHWHVTDSQSWPLEIPEYPLLSEKGAYSTDKVYSTRNFAHIQAFAASRGISVLVEVDVPGHTASIAEAYPDLVACANEDDWQEYGVQPPTGQLKLWDDTVLDFVRHLFTNLAARATGPFMSTGGDEVNKNCYDSGGSLGSTLKRAGRSIDQGISAIVKHAHDALRSSDKVPVVWEEMVLEHDLDLAKDTVVMAWISSEHAAAVLERGFDIVHAASDFFYLDCGGGGWLNNEIKPSWCDPFKSWQKIYSFDPYAGVAEARRGQVRGGESILWSEQADPSNLDALTWPRAAVAAEVFWTGALLPDGTSRKAIEALPRVQEWRYRAVNRGVKAAPIQPEWCALRPGRCQV